MIFSSLRTAVTLPVAGMLFLSGFVHPASAAAGNPGIGGQVLPSERSSAQQPAGLLELRPQSSIELPRHVGQVAHTHLRILIPPDGKEPVPVSHTNALRNDMAGALAITPMASSAASLVNTPASIACIYQLVAPSPGQTAGCKPASSTINPGGGAGAIAIVDAFDDPTAAADLIAFSSHFGLAPANFQVVYAGGPFPYITGTQPPADSGWELEEALDVEWAHAMAPGAKIFLVEAQDNSFEALLTAVVAAQYLVASNGGGEISMSWGSSEFNGETSYDTFFAPGNNPANVVALASSGDEGSVVSYPAVSPYVIGVGGTTINRNSGGAFISETVWSGSGGGVSRYEAKPSYQNIAALQRIVGSRRGTPDVSLDANPSSGVAVYLAGLWWIVGGTSVSAPTLAGILNAADSSHGFFATPAELAKLYTNGSNQHDFRDILSGSCGRNRGTIGYDLCTGWGSAVTYAGK